MKILNYFFFILLFIGITTANAQTWTQIGNDIDGEAEGDQSGMSVSLSSDGLTIAVGAPDNDGNESNAGHVRIYQNNSGTWTQIGADIDGEAENDNSGSSVSLSSDGSIVAIGADGNDGNGLYSGHVRIFQNNSGTWTQIGADIDGEATMDRSGCSVSLSSDGSVVAVGANNNEGNGDNAGHVRIYQNNSGTWTQTGDDIDGEEAYDYSGSSVSLSSDGSVVAVGAPDNAGNGTYSGHVRVYQNNSGTWTQIGADIDGEEAYDHSGISVSLSSDASTVAVGARYNTGNGDYSGHVRIFQNDAGTWTQIGDDIDGEAAGDQFGSSVSLSSDGSTVAIGALYNADNGDYSGHVRIFRNDAGAWTQIGSDIDGEAANDESGKSVSLSSDASTVAVGAPYNTGNGFDAGHVRVFDNPYVGISGVPKNDVFIYPNPANGIINFDFTDKGIQQIIITDITGKTILKNTAIGTLNKTIDLSDFADGIYIISIQTDKEIYTSKIVKEQE